MTTGLLSDVHQYADDTSLLITVNDPLSALHIINHDLVILQKWADQWRVTFNPSKTNFMTLSLKKPRQAPIPITWNNVAIEENTEFSILGVTIVNDMTWGSHILKLISKASKRLYVLRKYRDILPRKALETIYISMIRPILEYGDVLYNSMPLSTGRLLENIQRQAAIICSGAYRHTSYEKLLSELGWESLSTRRQNHKLIIFYKIFHHIYPNYLYNC